MRYFKGKRVSLMKRVVLVKEEEMINSKEGEAHMMTWINGRGV